MNPYIQRKIIKRQGTSFEEREDSIAVEKKLKVSVNGKDFITLYCTPRMIKELIVGLFLTEGIITEINPEDMKIEYGEEMRVDIASVDASTEGVITSRCIGGVTLGKKRNFEEVKDDFSLEAGALKSTFDEFQQRSELFRLTGCFHGAALSDGKRILVFAEDIGRHNAVDKVIGYSILENIPFKNKVMLVSCRLSSEIVSKCSRWGIPIVASRAAPTDLAIGIAETSGMTIAGFVRGDRMNIYTNPQRILL
ncbi:MAG: formate dehydrogenase accessory sulfurtransferase FdhD [Nitrospirota bacterium]